MERAAGFPNQRLVVVPRPLVREALERPITRRLVVTDAGVFPAAEEHGRYRPEGAEETIVILCVAGAGWVESGGARYDVGKATAVVLPGNTGEAHAYGASAEDPWTIWWCHVRGSDAAELVEESGVRAGRPIIPLVAVDRLTAMLDGIITARSRTSRRLAWWPQRGWPGSCWLPWRWTAASRNRGRRCSRR